MIKMGISAILLKGKNIVDLVNEIIVFVVLLLDLVGVTDVEVD
jgi:hypothetical protein